MLCNFPAKQLLEHRRSLAKSADTLDPNGQQLRDVMSCVMAIDTLRLLHEDINGCQCWAEAIGAEKAVAA